MFCQDIPGETANIILNNKKYLCNQNGCTSDKNSKANYCLEQQAREKIMNHRLFFNGPNGTAYNPAFPDLVRQGRMPANNFTYNPVDIESSLFNIGACDLVESRPPVLPRFKNNLDQIRFFDRPQLVKQEEFVPLSNQRPWPVCKNYS